jgi:glycolate oxidase FAD binding subunit
MSLDSLTIDGVGPMPVERPATVAELCDVVRRCAADGTAIYPVGGGTLLDYGTPPARPGIALSTANLNQIIDFPARDMTITAQAGITMARLHEITTTERLWLPIDVPNPETATLGGSIAANVSGPRRYGYGTFRDYVIGITLVNDQGEETKAGGRVVKNVAGYDLMKLYTGSLGTLGVITQVTLKLKPMPEAWASCLFFCGRDHLADALDLLHRSATRPSGVGFRSVYEGDKTAQVWALRIAFDGSSEAVTWQREQLSRELEPPGYSVADCTQGEGIMTHLAVGSSARFVCRTSLRTSGAPDVCRRVLEFGNVGLHGIAAGAIIRCDVADDGWTVADARRLLENLTESAQPAEGNVVIERCPTEWKKSLPVWGRPPTDVALQRAVKRALDSKGIFNPGRFVTDSH